MTPGLFILAITVAAPAVKEPPKADPMPLVGEWAGEKAEAAGMPLPIPPGGVTMEFKTDGKLIIREGAKPAEEATYNTDPKKDPNEIDITPPAAGGKLGPWAGIYKIAGDTLTLCLSIDGKRPSKFESTAGSATMLMTFKRARKKD
jgi:uncharacterized protein (TIGR03067 family)